MNSYDIDLVELDEASPRAEQPSNIRVNLKDHQRTLLQRCIEYENDVLTYNQSNVRTRMAVIADRVGSGKSYVLLALMRCNDITGSDGTSIRSTGCNNVVFYIPDTTRVVRTNVLVIPHNLCSQWDGYVKSFDPAMKYKIINRQRIIDSMILDSDFDIENYELLIVTGTFFNQVANYINRVGVKCQRVFVDEVDNINIPGCHQVNACFYWFVTASYGNLLYPRGYNTFDRTAGRYIWYSMGLKNSGFIKNIFTDLTTSNDLEMVKVLFIKNKEAYVEQSIYLPPINSHIIRCKTPASIRILNGVVDASIIQCLNADDTQSALALLNPIRRGTEDNIIKSILKKYKVKIENLNLNLRMTEQMQFEVEGDRDVHIERIQNSIREIEEKQKTIIERIKNSNMCSICLCDEIENKTIVNCCQNCYCFKCITMWMIKKPSCPLCKSLITSSDYMVVSEENSILPVQEVVNEEDTTRFDKYQNIQKILEKRRDESRFLMFSGYDYSFHEIIPILNSLGIQYDYLKGSGAHVDCVIKRYERGEIKVLLVNMRHYGAGANLTCTSDIIMMHKFDNQSEQQVIGRAQRMGRQEPLNVHYLLYENESR
jgi:hypothetical protein